MNLGLYEYFTIEIRKIVFTDTKKIQRILQIMLFDIENIKFVRWKIVVFYQDKI